MIRFAVIIVAQVLLGPLTSWAQQSVHINEIMYAPVSPEPEWIELYNSDTAAVDLTNWHIVTTSHAGVIPYGMIAGHGYLVLTKDSLTLVSIRPDTARIVQMPLPDLPNAGTKLILQDSALRTIDSVSYLPSWGGSTGASLERRSTKNPATDPTNWGASTAPNSYGLRPATPGALNSLAAPDSTPMDTAAPAKPLDLVINEIMFAPISPEPEWIELLNTTRDTINIGNWSVRVGTNLLGPLEGFFTIAPDSLAILTKFSAVFSPLDSVPDSRVAETSLPALNNNGSVVALYDSYGDFVDSVSYDGNWSPHGISIERIDPSKPGYIASNWAACRDPRGSTILRPNSVRRRDYDLAVTRIEASDTSILLMVTDEGRNPSGEIWVGLEIGSLDTVIVPVSGSILADSSMEVSVPLPENLFGKFSGIAYVVDSLDEDRSNDSLGFRIEFPIPPDSLVVNEIMFDPVPTSCAWLELYNPSASWISLDSTRLVTGETRPAEYSRWLTPLLIAPNSFGVVAADSSILFGTYPSLGHRGAVAGLGVSTLELGRDSCFLVLENPDSTEIDSVPYKKTWQQSLLKKTFVGISLERKDAAAASTDPNNWQASLDSAGATPLARNSGAATLAHDSIPPAGTEFAVHFDPTTFSPSDGMQNTTSLTIQSGNAASVWELRVRIYDMHGRMVRLLTDATPITGAALLSFDGKRDNGQILPPGIYAALIELTSQSPVRTLSKTVAVVIAVERR